VTDQPLPLEGLTEPTPTPATLSAGQRLTLRQLALIERGFNPLRGPAHPNATPEQCSPTAPKNQPYTCGTCLFRQHVRGYDLPKCAAPFGPRPSRSPTTDVRAWWPACGTYQQATP
jgi:hypothetical protein